MVGGNQQSATHCESCLHNTPHTSIDGLNSLDRGLQHTCMPNHIRVCIIHDHQVIFPTADMLYRRISNPRRAHLRLKVVGWHFRRWYQQPLLSRKRRLATAINKIGDMRILLCLCRMELPQTLFRDDPCKWHLNFVSSEGHCCIQSLLVGRHHHILQVLQPWTSIKFPLRLRRKLFQHECFCQLAGAIWAEIIVNQCVAGLNYCDWLLVFHHYRWHNKFVCDVLFIGLLNCPYCRSCFHTFGTSHREIRQRCAIPAVIPMHRIISTTDCRHLCRVISTDFTCSCLEKTHKLNPSCWRGITTVG